MNVYALFPLIATLAYIPLLVTTLSSRPWQRQYSLFLSFLVPAMAWSSIDYVFRSNLLAAYNDILFDAIIIVFALMAVQLHCFASSYFASGQSRWLPVAYASLVLIVPLTLMGYVTKGVIVNGDVVHGSYRVGVLFVIGPLLILAARDFYVFGKQLKALNNPALSNQIMSLMLGLAVVIVFTATTLLPWGKEFPLSHFGNLVNAFILTYAVVRHKLVDIRIVLRQSSAVGSLVLISMVSYWVLLIILRNIFHFQIDMAATFVATGVGLMVAIFVYKLRHFLVAGISRIFQGESYDYRQKLSDFADRIHNIFSLKEQGGELLTLVSRAIGCKRDCLLFPETGSEDFTTQLFEPKSDNPLSGLKLRGHSPIVEYLSWERKPLTRENLAILPGFLSLWEEEKEDVRSREIELFIPLISRGRLVAILVVGKKHSGKYSLEDLTLLESITNRVAVSVEKEYLREQLREREEELSVINRSNAIITSSLNIQGTYDSFINELKKVVDVSWAAITLIEENNLYFLALSTEIGSAWKVGERVPVKGTATEWVATHRKSMVEPDISIESRFATGKYHLMQGIHSIAYFPLIARDEVIGSLIVASCHPGAYSPRHMVLLEQLSSQASMPVENARLYAKAEEKARIDELTGLLNRRALDEMVASEISRHSRYGGVFSMILIDLDTFKTFNDTYGHLAGDKLLRQIGSIIKGAVRSVDQAFRYGGDEFAVILPQTLVDSANQVAERIRKHIASKFKDKELAVTASLGLASWPADGISANEILSGADGALYHAKRGGGDRSHCASGMLLPLDELIVNRPSEVGPGGNEDSSVLSTIYALAATVDARDHTHDHSKWVSEYASALAKALNLEPLEVSRLESCALLHDIGKIGIHDEILNKPAKLTDEEWAVVKTHPQLGATIVGRTHQLNPCVAGILYHHERYDGSGYPRGLKGDNIPLEARILAIADAFAAMTSQRPYAQAMSYDRAVDEIKRGAGTQFDPHLAELFVGIIKEKVLVPQEKA
ncbi:MAG: diguanylate cyclase [Dehalococcoidales bacterium]|nr:diguanylate cyclase [Dehalococcoidales bacterium]